MREISDPAIESLWTLLQKQLLQREGKFDGNLLKAVGLLLGGTNQLQQTASLAHINMRRQDVEAHLTCMIPKGIAAFCRLDSM